MKTLFLALSICAISIAFVGCDDSFSQQPSLRDKPDKPTPTLTPVSSASPIKDSTPPNLPSIPPDISPTATPPNPAPTASSSGE